MAITSFNKLALYLKEQEEGTIKLTFDEVERILGFELPGSAKAFKTWWTLSDNKQVQAWQAYGYKVINDPVAEGAVIFKKYTTKKEAKEVTEEDKVIKEFKKEEQEKFEGRKDSKPRNFDRPRNFEKSDRPRRDFGKSDKPRNFDRSDRPRREDRPRRDFDRNNRYE